MTECRLTLTSFVRIQNGSTIDKLTRIRDAFARHQLGYRGRTDFYEPWLRGPLMDTALRPSANGRPGQESAFVALSAGLDRLRRRAQLRDVSPVLGADLAASGVRLRVNAQALGRTATGEQAVWWLHLCEEPLRRSAANVALRMLECHLAPAHCAVARVVDVRRGIVYTPPTRYPAHLDDFIATELAQIGALWARLSAA